MAYLYPDLFINKIIGEYAILQSVVVASTANVDISTNLNGVNIDGQTLTTGQRLLLKNQSTGVQNGVYIVGAGAGTTVRSDDMVAGQTTSGVIVPVEVGVVNGDSLFVCTGGTSSVVGINVLIFTLVMRPGLRGNVKFSAIQTLTNKTMTAATNNITADQFLTTGSNVVFSTATEPISGQFLVATSAVAANWQTIAAPSGEANTASNVNTLGVGLFANKTGVDLRFKSISTTTANGISVAVSGVDNWISPALDLASVNRALIGGILSPAKGGTGFGTIPGSGSRFMVTNGASAFTTKNHNFQFISDVVSVNQLASVQNKTVTDISNFVVAASLQTTTVNSLTSGNTVLPGIARSTFSSSITIGSYQYPFTTIAYQVSETDTTASTTSLVTKLQVTFSAVAGRTYVVRWYCEGEIAVPVTGTQTLTYQITHRTTFTELCGVTNPSITGIWPFGGQASFVANVTSATFPVALRFRSYLNGQIVTMRKARILVFNEIL